MSSPEKVSHVHVLDQLAVELERLLDTGSAESVHRMRVSAGRLSVWLELSGRRVLRDDLRWMRGSAAHVRDVDVMSSSERHPAWREHLESERAAALSSARANLTGTRARAVIAAISYLPPVDRPVAEAGLRRLARRALRAGESLRVDEREAELLHRARRRFRRLRYALEWLGHDAGRVKSLQDAFGASNDASVERAAWDRLPPAIRSRVDDTTTRAVVGELEARVDARRKAALALWRENADHVRALARPEGTT